MSEEVRYAILIGINDYKNNELRYCDNDVIQLKKCLIQNCQYNPDNIFEIISTKSTPVTDVYQDLQNIITKLTSILTPQTDSILFYFSGHGKLKHETFIELHDKSISTQAIFDQIKTLTPKQQVYILDACHSGFGIEFKASDSDTAMIQYYNKRYINNAQGIFFLCSCKQDEKSKAFPEYKNGVFTKYIIEAINNTHIYDDETNTLSIPAIHEYTLKKILLVGKYQQTPFIQMQSSGFYPFAFKTTDPTPSFSCESIINTITKDTQIEDFFRRDDLNLSQDLRRDLFHLCSELTLNQFNHGFTSKIEIEISGSSVIMYDYSQKSFNPFEAQPTEKGIGIKVVKDFMNRYKNVCDFSYTAGKPNITKLLFDARIHNFQYDNPCFIELTHESVRTPTNLNALTFNASCKELTIDATKALIWGSSGQTFLFYLIKRTEDAKPLIILKMDKNDFTKEYLIPLTKTDYYSRIMII